MRLYLQVLLYLFVPVCLSGQWSQCNGPYGGNVDFVAQNPVTKTIFAGSYQAGLYRLKANSNKWESLQNKFAPGNITAVAAIDSFVCVALYPSFYGSYDDGDTWFAIDSAELHYASNVYTDDSVLVVTAEGFFYTKGGRNFTYIPMPFEFVKNMLATGNRLIVLYSDTAFNFNIAYSDNWGQTWVNVLSTPGVHPLEKMNPFVEYKDSLYLFVQNSLQFVSGDEGENWVLEQCSGQPFCNHPFDQLIESTYGLLDGGPDGISYYDTTWHNMTEDGLNVEPMQFICRYQNSLYTYYYSGPIYKSTDEGDSWQTAFNIPQDQTITDMVNNGNLLNIYCQNNTHYYSSDGLVFVWDSINAAYINAFTDVQDANNRIYALGNADRTIDISDDNGKTWDTLQWAVDHDNFIYTCNYSGFAADSQAIVLPLLYNVTPPYNFSNYSDILYSHDGGLTFNQSNFSYLLNANDFQCALLGNKAFIIAGPSYSVVSGPLYKSNDAGVNWYLDSLLKHTFISIYTIAPNFVVLGTDSGKILLSSDTGGNFTDITGNFPSTANQFYFLGTQLYAITPYSGIWKTDATALGIPNNFYIAQLANGTSEASLFPNPAHNSITINLAASITYTSLGYKIYNTLGQLLANGTAQVQSGTFFYFQLVHFRKAYITSNCKTLMITRLSNL